MYAAHQRALSFKQLPNLFTARAARNKRVPTIGGLATRGLAGLSFDLFAAIQHSAEYTLQLRLAQLAQYPDAELAHELVDGALQHHAELAVRGHQLQAAVNAGHGADGNKASASAAGQALDHRCGGWGLPALLRSVWRLGQTLAR